MLHTGWFSYCVHLLIQRIELYLISRVQADVRFHACLSELMLPISGQPMKPLIYWVIDQTPNGTDCLGQEWKQECSTATCWKEWECSNFHEGQQIKVLQRPWEERRPGSPSRTSPATLDWNVSGCFGCFGIFLSGGAEAGSCSVICLASAPGLLQHPSVFIKIRSLVIFHI